MQKKIFCVVLFSVLFSSLNGCGTKGPLYIPEQQYPQPKAAK
ncbi:MAG: lipoprotein [Methylotenera sp.]